MKKNMFLLIFAVISFFILSCGEDKQDKGVYSEEDLDTTETVSNPQFSKQSGTYQEELSIEVSTVTKDASIYYTIDGTDPDDKSTQYSEPIVVSLETTTLIKAVAYKDKLKPSAIVSANYEVTGVLDLPEFNISPGVYPEPQSVSLSHNDPEVTIKYTTDGTDPTSKSKTYSVPFSLGSESTTDIRAKAFKAKWGDSDIAQGLFVITGTVMAPEFATEQGIFTEEKSITITCENPDAEIRYEVYNEDGGADPTETSTLYTQPFLIPLDTTSMVKARAFLKGWNPSPVITGKFIVTGTVDQPVFSPIEGTYTSEQSVTIGVSTEGAVVRYTLDGTEPTELSPLHSTPIAIPLDTELVIKAKGFKKDWASSDTVGGNYKITGKVADPLLSVIPNYYTNAQNVALTTTTKGASIKFTIDGTEPSKTHGNEYVGAIPVASTTTLKAIAYKTDWIDSNISEGQYFITGQVAAPVFTPTQGNYTDTQTVSLQSNIPGVTIRYTTDGSNPSRTAGVIYSDPFTVSKTTTLKAFAYREDWETTSDSPVSTASYTITGTVFKPGFNIEPGNYTLTKTVALSSETVGAEIRYTLDGSDPSRTGGTLYSTGIVVDKPLTIKAVAYKPDWEESSDSEIATGEYNITGKVYPPQITPTETNHTDNVEVTLSSITPGAKIKYTTNGDNPTRIVGTSYADPFTISTGSTVKAIAFKDEWEESSNSDISSKIYTITGKVIKPKFDITPGNYTTNKTVKITTETPGAIIRYTTDETVPTRTNGDIYTTAGIAISQTATLKAFAYKTDWQESSNSDVITGIYTITGTVHAPDFTPTQQNHTDNVEITLISITEGASIRYTTDGTTNPTRVVGNSYAAPFTVSANTTVKAIAFKDDWEESSNSSVSSKIYTITGKVEKPKLSVEPGNYTNTVSLTLSCDTPAAKMRYTIDESDPSRTSGTLYTGTISIPSTRTVKVIAYKEDWQETSNSDITTGLFTITGKVATPVMNPYAANYTTTTAVTITTDTEGATIRYTTNGVAPTRDTGTLYTTATPVQIESTATIKAIAYKNDWQSTSDSNVASGLYTITGKVANPIISPQTGFYMSTQSVTISCATSGAKIKYTIDGSDPSEINGFLYSGAFNVPSTATVKAFAYNDEWQISSDSDIISETLTITGKVIAPAFSPAGGKYTNGQTVSITSQTQEISENVVIRYSLDGSTPTRSSTLYTEPVLIGETKDLKAIAYVPQWEEASDSSVSAASYEITGIVPAPEITPDGGDEENSISVSISAITGATIKYTTDGSDPSRHEGEIYSGPITLTRTCTLKTMAFINDWEESSDSALASAKFKVFGNVAAPTFSPEPLVDPTTDPVYITLSSLTPGATIRYTTTGIDPSTTEGEIYTGTSITLSQPTTIRAIAYIEGEEEDWTKSGIVEKPYTMKVKTPVLSPKGKTYNIIPTVSIASATTGVTYYYSKDGTPPSTPYYDSISIPESCTLKAYAKKSDGSEGWVDSDIVEDVYTLRSNTPQFSVSDGLYTKTQKVKITTPDTPPPFQIRYQTLPGGPLDCEDLPGDVTDPIVYTKDSLIPIEKNKNLRAIVCKTNWEDSVIGNVFIEIKASTPTIDPPAGEFTTFPQTVTITSETPGVDTNIYCTTDGSEPVVNQPPVLPTKLCNHFFDINEPSVIKAIATSSDCVNSDIATAVLFGTPTIVNLTDPTASDILDAIENATVPSIIDIKCETTPCLINETINMTDKVSLRGNSENNPEDIVIQGTTGNSINFPSGIISTTFIENLTVIGAGNTTETKGIYINSNASPTIRNCIINGGNGSETTYGIFNQGLSPQIIENKIEGDNGSDSYGIYNANSTRPLIENNIIYGGDNDRSYGIFNMNSEALIISNEIDSGNSTTAYSIFNDNSNNVKIFGNHIKGCSDENLCSDSCGINISNDATVFIVNNLIEGGMASASSYGINNKSKDLIVSNNTISGGSAPESHTIYNMRDPNSSDSLDISIKNNILYTENSSAGTFCLYEKNSKSYFTIVKNNNFFNCETLLFKDGATSIKDDDLINTYDGMSGNINEDPIFTDFKPGQVSLQNGLNLYNDYYFPTNTDGKPVDYDGVIRSSSYPTVPWWIGAYEM